MEAHRREGVLLWALIALIGSSIIIPFSAIADPIGVFPNYPYLFSYGILTIMLVNFPLNLFMISLCITIWGKKREMGIWGDLSKAKQDSTGTFLFLLGSATFFITAFGALVDAVVVSPFVFSGADDPSTTVLALVLGGAFGAWLICLSIAFCLRFIMELKSKICWTSAIAIAVINPASWGLLLLNIWWFRVGLGWELFVIIPTIFTALSVVLLLYLRKLHSGRSEEILSDEILPEEKMLRRKKQVVIANVLVILLIVALLIIPVINYRPPHYHGFVIISLQKSSNATNWIFTVNSISAPDSLWKEDCSIMVRKGGDGTIGLMSMVLSTMTSGTNYNGVRFLDTGSGNAANQVNVGDQIILDKTIYLIGSQVIITSVDGTTIYASYTV